MSRVLTKNIDPEARDLTRLTKGEEVWLWRIRQPSPNDAHRGVRYMSQIDAAKKLGIGIGPYRNLEASRRFKFTMIADMGSVRDVLRLVGEIPSPTIAEMCVLARRRSGLKLADMADRLGTTHVSIIQWEKDADSKIVRFWMDEGYNFTYLSKVFATTEKECIA